MQDRSNEKVTSPPSRVCTTRVEDGKVKKLRSSGKNDSPAIQHINGKTYACESCKRGHRVHKCDHGKTRPISETNQPGRPSGGQKRGCQCPRNCACTTKTCKCERDCSCTQEMYLIVRLDNPMAINRDATSTPKPVWEDANGNKMTLKKVWADANGKEIGDEEYQERKRRMEEREEGAISTPELPKPSSSCCSSIMPKQELESPPEKPAGGCRHRQNIAAAEPQPHSGSLTTSALQQPPKTTPETWMSACSCGSGCSCLYCPDHPNNATSINHTQQQFKHLARQAYNGGPASVPMPLVSAINSTSCMGGRPSVFLSRTPDVSQQQLQQFFPDDLDPNAIYLTYPIQQHSWTNQPTTAHCSHVQSPSGTMTLTPETSETYVDPLNDLASQSALWELFPDDSNGTWNFSEGEMGDTSFSWIGVDASQGTDYNIGQATVASMSTEQIVSIPSISTGQQPPSVTLTMEALESPSALHGLPVLEPGTFPDSPLHFDPQNAFDSFNVQPAQGAAMQSVPAHPLATNMPFQYSGQSDSQDLTLFGDTPLLPFGVSQHQPEFRPTIARQMSHVDRTSTPWIGCDSVDDKQIERDLKGTSMSNSPPIANLV